MNTTHAIVIHDLVQGSREWHVYRAEHLNASDASAMLGSSPYQTRDELKQRLHTGLAADVDPRTQARYDNGHRIEALARPLGEDVLCDELVPMVVSRGKFSASLDGAVPFATPTVIRFTRLWEHKQLNDALRAAMVEGATGADLPKPYRVQMEQQLFCTDAEDVLFTASDWDGDTLIEARHVVYVSDPDLREEILAGWQLLEEEMVSYVPPTAGAIVIARTYAAMPSLKFDVSGDLQIKHNLGVYLQALETFAAAAPKKPSTDQEFADADSAGKKGREIAVVARHHKGRPAPPRGLAE
jgi:putative phage-type endonuclease